MPYNRTAELTDCEFTAVMVVLYGVSSPCPARAHKRWLGERGDGRVQIFKVKFKKKKKRNTKRNWIF